MRDTGLVFFVGGIIILVGYGTFKLTIASKAPLPIMIGILGIIVGAAILLISLIKERVKEGDEGADRKY